MDMSSSLDRLHPDSPYMQSGDIQSIATPAPVPVHNNEPMIQMVFVYGTIIFVFVYWLIFHHFFDSKN